MPMGDRTMRSFHVAVAAEAFAAGLLARAGCDVLVQYGANQPEYDLVATKGDRFLKVSVKGSQSGGWGLIQSYKRGYSYHEAIERWVIAQSPHVIYCFVQFFDVPFDACPRVYLATVDEVAQALKVARGGLGSTILYENYMYSRGVARSFRDSVPSTWAFTVDRVDELLVAAHSST
ncbi:MAG TPA: hypothetical protein VF092_28950 [Longimicrobium sp.]